MSDKTIDITNAIGGVPTDYDAAPVLRDATGTYGMRVLSSGALVTGTLNAALTKLSTGSYSITVTGLTAGVVYQYALSRTYLGVTKTTVETFTAEDANYLGGSVAGVEGVIGSARTADQWADSDGTGDATVIANAYASALGKAVTWVTTMFAKRQTSVPTSGSTYYDALAEIVNERAAARMFFVWRWGQAEVGDNTKAMTAKMQQHAEHAEAELKGIIGAMVQQRLNSTATFTAAATAMDSGTNGARCPALPGGYCPQVW